MKIYRERVGQLHKVSWAAPPEKLACAGVSLSRNSERKIEELQAREYCVLGPVRVCGTDVNRAPTDTFPSVCEQEA